MESNLKKLWMKRDNGRLKTHLSENSDRIAHYKQNIFHIWSCFCDRVSFTVPKNRSFSTHGLPGFAMRVQKETCRRFLILRQALLLYAF